MKRKACALNRATSMSDNNFDLKQIKISKKGNKLAKQTLHATRQTVLIGVASLVIGVSSLLLAFYPVAMEPIYEFIHSILSHDEKPSRPEDPPKLVWDSINESGNSFYISDVITNDQYSKFRNSNHKSENCPLQIGRSEPGLAKVSWFCAVEFAIWISNSKEYVYSLASVEQLTKAKKQKPDMFGRDTEWSRDCITQGVRDADCQSFYVFGSELLRPAKPSLQNKNVFRLTKLK